MMNDELKNKIKEIQITISIIHHSSFIIHHFFTKLNLPK